MKLAILIVGLLMGLQAMAFTVTQTGSGVSSWTTSTSCWSACYNANRQAKARLQAVASNMCPGGYTVTQAPQCNWPRQDNSFLDWGNSWPVCKCSDTCTAKFSCNRFGQFPVFAARGQNNDQQILAANKRRMEDYEIAAGEMERAGNPEAIYTYAKQAHVEGLVNATKLFEQFERGRVRYVRVPSFDEALAALDPVEAFIQVGKELGVI